MKLCLLFGLCIISALGCQSTSTKPAQLKYTKPISVILGDTSQGRSVVTPLTNEVLLQYFAITNDGVVFKIFSSANDFLPATNAIAGDVLPFTVSGNRFQLEVLAIGVSKNEAIKIAELNPAHYKNELSYPENKEYSAIRISPLPPS